MPFRSLRPPSPGPSFPSSWKAAPRSSRSATSRRPYMHKTIAGFGLLLAVCAFADFSGSYTVPLTHPAIQYAEAPVNDRAAALQHALAAGTVHLAYDGAQGYLRAVL